MEWYINKEKAIESIKRKRPKVLYSEYGVGYERGLEDAIGLLNATPSENVQPVRHGHWEDHHATYIKQLDACFVQARCSCCGRYSDKMDYSQYLDLEYCSHCGADMRKETARNE